MHYDIFVFRWCLLTWPLLPAAFLCRTDPDLREVMMKVEKRVDDGRMQLKREVGSSSIGAGFPGPGGMGKVQ